MTQLDNPLIHLLTRKGAFLALFDQSFEIFEPSQAIMALRFLPVTARLAARSALPSLSYTRIVPTTTTIFKDTNSGIR
jgi:hypothetical protein